MGLGEISMCGRTNCARTDISPLACTPESSTSVSATPEKQQFSQCTVEIWPTVWRSRSTEGPEQGGFLLGSPDYQPPAGLARPRCLHGPAAWSCLAGVGCVTATRL